MAESCLSIHTLSLHTQLIHAGNQPTAHPQSVKRRLQKLAETRLIKNLQEQLSPLDGDNNTVVIIHKLAVDFDIDLLLSEAEMSRLWSAKIKTAIVRTLSSQQSQQVITFPDQAVYLQHFIIDLLAGCAWQRWYYNRFKGLKVLPLSSVLRTLLVDEVETAIKALQTMDIDALHKITTSLSPQDITIVQTHWLSMAENLPTAPIDTETIAAEMSATAVKRQLANLDPKQSVFFRTLVALNQAATSDIKAIIKVAQWVDLLDTVLKHPKWNSQRLIQCLHANNISLCRAYIAADKMAILLSIVALPAQAITQLVSAIQKADHCHKKRTINPSNDLRFSQYGNALLLLPTIENLGLEKLSHHCSKGDEYPLAAALKLLILSLCQGANKFEMAFYDPLLQDLCGFAHKHNNSLAQVFSILENIPTLELDRLFNPIKQQYALAQKTQTDKIFLLLADEQLQAVAAPCHKISALLSDLAYIILRLFARRLPGFSQSSLPYLWTRFLSMSVNMRFEQEFIIAQLSKVPMSVLLNMTGINRGQLLLPAFDQRPIRYSESA